MVPDGISDNDFAPMMAQHAPRGLPSNKPKKSSKKETSLQKKVSGLVEKAVAKKADGSNGAQKQKSKPKPKPKSKKQPVRMQRASPDDGPLSVPDPPEWWKAPPGIAIKDIGTKIDGEPTIFIRCGHIRSRGTWAAAALHRLPRARFLGDGNSHTAILDLALPPACISCAHK